MTEVIVFVVAFVLGWKLREYRAMMIVRAIEKRLMEQPGPKIQLLHAKIEDHDGVFVAHNAATNQFLLQGTSYKDVITQLKTNYPNHTILTQPVD